MHVLQYSPTPLYRIGTEPVEPMALAVTRRPGEKTVDKSHATISRLASHARKQSAKLATSKDDNKTLLELKLPTGSIPRTEAHAVETEVLMYRYLRKLGLPVPSVVGLTRSKPSDKVVAASITSPDGIVLSSASWPSSDARWLQAQAQIDHARSTVDRQHSRSFGTFTAVAGGKGVQSWPLAFALMFEALLEDGEDDYVNIPYAEIRKLLAHSGRQLQRTTTAQLVVPDLGRPSHVLVDQSSGTVTGFLGCRTAYWGDPDLCSPTTPVPIYRCFQAVRTIIESHFRPSVVVGEELIQARATLVSALNSAYLY